MFDRQLRYFLTCAQELSFTRAAERLDISQPALSQQMRRFENKLGQSLFIRRGRGVSLTTAGMKLRQQVEPHFLELDQIVREFRHQQGVSEGVISIASVHPVLSYLLPNLIAAYTQRHPKVEFNLRCGASLEVIELTANQTVDIGLIYNNVVSDMKVEFLFTEQLSAVFSPKLSMANEILRTKTLPNAVPLVMSPPSYSLRRVVDNALKKQSSYVQIETETVDSMLNLVHAGAGVCFLPAYTVKGYTELYQCELTGIDMQVPVALIIKPDVPMSPIVSQVVKNIKELAEKQPFKM